MATIKTYDDIKHPEGKIQLINGTVLDCYPLEQANERVDNGFPKLDTTGTYFVIGRRRPAAQPKIDEEKEAGRKLFLDNAFRFLLHRNRILSDSRMFLCPVPIQSGLAYTGTSGFHCPTLGVYLEWWLNCEIAKVYTGIGPKKLVYLIAGSPLSGCNRCGIVDENGNTETESISSFATLWSNFMRINRRYDEAKSLYQAYTLKQVVELLDRESLSLTDDIELENLFLKNALNWQKEEVHYATQQLERQNFYLKSRLFYEHRDELKTIMAIFNEKKEKKEQREKEIDEECQVLYRKLESGEIDERQCKKKLIPLKKEKDYNIFALRQYRRSALEPLFPDSGLNLSDVEEYFNFGRNYKQ